MRKISIVGAGLVGSLWAVFLRRQGHTVSVYERRRDPRKYLEDGGRSINLVITSRGLHGLDQAGLLSAAMELAVPVYGRVMHTKAGQTMYQPYGQQSECNYSISRAVLNRMLIEEAEKLGALMHFDHDLSALDLESKRCVFQTSRGAKEASYDLLFGTDGAGSRVRKQLVEQRPKEFQDRIDWLEADYKELTLPLRSDGAPALRKDGLHIWPRGQHMMMALANRDGSFTVTVYLPRKNAIFSFDKIDSTDAIENLFESEFPDAIPLMPHFVSEWQSHPQGPLGTVRTSKWVFQDSVALLGDAAHAIVPFFGQGMNSGFEDCTTLMKLFSELNGDWKRALELFDQVQRPNANAIADMALENWVEMRDRVADEKFLLRKKIEAAVELKFPGLYKSRYGMITYTLIPYLLAQKAGLIQDRIMAQLVTEVQSVENLNWAQVEQLLEREWRPFIQQHSLKL